MFDSLPAVRVASVLAYNTKSYPSPIIEPSFDFPIVH